MTFPDNCKYTSDHEWVRIEDGNIAFVGITDYAQSELGELVYIEVDTLDESVEAGDPFGTVEAVKTTSELFMPVSGKILEVNEKVDESGDPAIINEDPYGEGWIVKIELSDVADMNGLMDSATYQESL